MISSTWNPRRSSVVFEHPLTPFSVARTGSVARIIPSIGVTGEIFLELCISVDFLTNKLLIDCSLASHPQGPRDLGKYKLGSDYWENWPLV